MYRLEPVLEVAIGYCVALGGTTISRRPDIGEPMVTARSSDLRLFSYEMVEIRVSC